jgi:hypothetical protein
MVNNSSQFIVEDLYQLNDIKNTMLGGHVVSRNLSYFCVFHDQT